MSTTGIILLNLAILGVVLIADLGRRTVSLHRIIRPLIVIGAIVPFFVSTVPSAGNDLVLQTVGLGTGVLLGLVCHLGLRVESDPPAARVISSAGAAYALIWIAVTAGRLGFLYATRHGSGPDVGRFLFEHQLSAAALTNSFVGLSVAMAVTRSLLLGLRASAARGLVTGAHPAAI